LAGFAGGGYIALNLIHLLGIRPDHLIWLPYFIGGLIGVLLMLYIFDWALIIISALAGAAMIVQALSLGPGITAGMYLMLVICGVIVQIKIKSDK
jgi:hypothetical protein